MLPNWMINPRMMQALTPVYASTGTIQTSTEVQDAAGQPIKTWVNLAGHVSIPCNIQTTGGNETKATNQIYATATHDVLLSGYYPLITPKMRLVDGAGFIYDILLVNHDSFGSFTRLIAEIR